MSAAPHNLGRSPFPPPARALAAARAFMRRHWIRLLRIRERFRLGEETLNLVLAGVVGVIGGLVNLAFYHLVRWGTMLSVGSASEIVESARRLPAPARLLIPAAGGLLAGAILHWGLRLAGRAGPNNIVEAVVAGDGRLRMRGALVKGLSSLVSICSGASIGREGAITQMTATLASKAGQLAHWPPYRLRLLVACGAASGIAAAYNAPVAGAVFAAQIILGNFAMNLFAPIVFASVVATMVSRSFFGIDPWYRVPAFEVTSIYELPLFIVLGVLAGGLGAFFLKALKYMEDLLARPGWPVFGRLALGGLLVGVLAVPFPEVWGNGYSTTNLILSGPSLALWALLGIFCAKLLATLASVGSGAVGGVFTPTLFLGAALGSLFGTGLHALDLAADLPLAAFALAGMSAVLAATVHAPLLALILLVEISLNYSLMPALMLASVTAALVARKLHPESVYTAPLRRQGGEWRVESERLGAATSRTVGELMREPVAPIRETTPFREIAERFLTGPNNFLPVVDATRRLVGIVALQDLKEHLGSELEFHSVIAFDVMRPPPPCLTPDQHLIDALPTLLASELRNVPVVNNREDGQLVGAVRRGEALGLLSDAISARTRTGP